jgi:hypothetical protein
VTILTLSSTQFKTSGTGDKSVTSYISVIVAVAKEVHRNYNNNNLIIAAWEGLDLPLQHTVDEPDREVTITQFIDRYPAQEAIPLV